MNLSADNFQYIYQLTASKELFSWQFPMNRVAASFQWIDQLIATNELISW